MLEQVETLAGKGKQVHACFWQEGMARAPVLPLTPVGGGRSQGWSSGWDQHEVDELV